MRKIIKQLRSVLLGTLIVMFICACGKDTAHYIKEEESLITTEDVVSTELSFPEAEDVLYIYVCGAIQNPGVYTLPDGSRVYDLFDAAGGLTAEAATDYWNQARLLVDGEMLYVPTKEEVESENLQGGDNTGYNDDNKNKKININTASLEELMTIPGIGQAKASAIISYREAHGKFKSIDEVKNVEGIKDGVFSKMKEYIDIN